MRATIQSETPGTQLTIEEPFGHSGWQKTKRRRTALQSPEEDLARALFILLIPIIAIEAIFRSVAKGMWFDEVLTVLVSGQAHISGIWNLLTHGVDGHPLGIYLIEHVMGKLGGNERLTFRLPAIAAFLCVMTCLFFFIRKRAGGLVALISAAVLLLTNLYDPFAFEARSYGMTIAFIALALMCYERAESKKWAFLFAVCLAAACSMHFYAVLAFFPFGLAELTHLYATRRLRPQIWIAFGFGVLPYLAFWPILSAQRALYGAHFWATPTFWHFLKGLGELTHLKVNFSVAIFVSALFFVGYLAYSGNFRARPTGAPGSGYSPTDLALILGFLLMPIVTFVSAIVGHGGFSGRYVTVADLGISIGLSLFLSRLNKPALASAGLLVLCMFLIQEGSHWAEVMKPRGNNDSLNDPMKLATKMDVPLVVSNGLIFLQLWHRESDQLKSRIFTLDDPQEQFAASQSDTSTLLLETLKKYVPINLQTFPDFATQHRKFLLYSNGDAEDFWPRWLVERGYSPRVVAIGGSTRSATDFVPDSPKAIIYFVDLDERK